MIDKIYKGDTKNFDVGQKRVGRSDDSEAIEIVAGFAVELLHNNYPFFHIDRTPGPGQVGQV